LENEEGRMAGDLSHECERSSSRETGGINSRQRFAGSGLADCAACRAEVRSRCCVDFAEPGFILNLNSTAGEPLG
jgi:hypothetical protein